MWELILAVLFGCVIGTVTGLLPGLHTNTVAILVFGVSGVLLQKFDFMLIGVFLISMVVVHSFVDYIPSIFLGAPESSTALSVLPGHKMLSEGKGFEALKSTIVGGISAFMITLLLLPLLIKIVGIVGEHISFLAGPILLILVVYFILLEVENLKIIWATILYSLAGVLGLVVLGGLHISQPLFPMLSGLFGVSILISSMNSRVKIPKQTVTYETNVFSLSNILDGLKALLAGGFMGLLPTLGPSQAAVLAQGFSGFKRPDRFLVVLGGINTVDTLFTLTTLYVIGKARSGVLVVIQRFVDLNLQDYLILVVTAFSALGFAVYITIKTGRFFANWVDRFPYTFISLIIIILVSTMVWIFSGKLGLLVLVVAAAIGLLSQLVGVRKIHAMACLSLPVIVGSL